MNDIFVENCTQMGKLTSVLNPPEKARKNSLKASHMALRIWPCQNPVACKIAVFSIKCIFFDIFPKKDISFEALVHRTGYLP